MAILACETFTQEYCYASHLGGTLIGRLRDGAIYFVPRGEDTNSFRANIREAETWNLDKRLGRYDKLMKKDKYVTVHKQGHYIQLHNRPLGAKPWRTKSPKQENGSFDF